MRKGRGRGREGGGEGGGGERGGGIRAVKMMFTLAGGLTCSRRRQNGSRRSNLDHFFFFLSFSFSPFPPLFSVLPLLPSVHSSSSSSSFALLFARPRWQGSEATLPFITDFHPFLHPPSQILKEKTKRHIKYNHQQQQYIYIYIYIYINLK